MKNLVLILLIVSAFSCSSKKNMVNATKDVSGNLVGIAAKENFQVEPYNSWFQPNYDSYTLNAEVIEKLKPIINNVTIKAFMGTWCGDSQQQTPVFYKILDATGFNYKNLQLIAVNRSKSTPDNLQEGFDIVRVPTFIFFKEGKEIGRFVEYPRETVENDILKIVSGEPYKHSYEE
ncbi:thioredoxin family protein [Lutibacter maritimus]|uniref:Thiol-disulfide isomerase or thioredoxin n=1 Tax=Lutibacter maritimus TaxID=593133 RepID=A0A1I6RJM4_9FLAO|nr:thioredoxin family protein [Lutibacter maritimus]SFS64846.1 Thiol-disulfide isomerase or thioredoxin [Lutibacter maritimus]